MTMLIEEKKLSCIRAETGTLIFAILNVIATGVASILSIILFITSVVAVAYEVGNPNPNNQIVIGNLQHGAIMFSLSLFLMMASFIAFVFAVFLIHGVCKKNAAHLKAYFVYGVVVILLSTLPFAACSVFAIGMRGSEPAAAPVGLLVSVAVAMFIYSLILIMIRRTYKKFEITDIQYNHQPLKA